MLYYGTKLSQNISRREPEGYLLCLNVPVARSGTQEYLPEEVGRLPDHGALVTVYRPEEEVFSPECIASFEGMPVTDDHPEDPEGVTVETCSALQKGHAQNLRRGTGPESDLLIADLLITDPVLIDHILSGKREISCGYNYELCQENGKFIQRKIRGNHIAVVDAGRAGHRVSIKDHKSERRISVMQKNKKNLVSRLIASFAKDEDTTAEEVAAVVEAILSEDPAALTEAEPAAPVVTVVPAETPAEPAAVVVEVPTETESEAPVTGDEDPSAAILERLDRILELLTNLTAPVPAADEEETALPEEVGEALEAVATDPIGEAIEQVIGEIAEEAEEEPVSLIDECSEEEEQADCGKSSTTSDTLRSVLQVMKPVIAAMPKAQRKQVSDRLAKQIRSANGQKTVPESRNYAALKNTRRASADAEDPRALGKRIMAARNVNNRK